MRRKGTFGDSNLPISKKYIFPPSRKNMIWIGVVAAALILCYALININFQESSFISNGPLSSNHANFGNDCAACHDQFASVTNEKCNVCHEKFGDKLGVYSYDSHYLYRSDDFRRLVSSVSETPCFSCHAEHLGRDANITKLTDSQCLKCHQFGSFNQKHPEFEFAAQKIPDNSGLKFTHIDHVNRVMQRENLVDIEKACLRCHNTKSDGKSFEAISFDRHCDTCHLTSSINTPWLPIRTGSNTPGVETLQGIKKLKGPGTLWAFYVNHNEFRKRGNNIRKSPIYHKDPWIMENMKLIRRRIFPNIGIADLLTASADVPAHEVKLLYEEAIAKLKEYLLELRARPERQVQSDLVSIDRALKQIEKRLRDPYSTLDDTKFLLSIMEPNPRLTENDFQKYESLVDKLTQPCQMCHEVENATVVRVQKDQRVLRRAEFNHRDHILQKRCLECHTGIPFTEILTSNNKSDASIDRAAIQNIPTIETCQECHQPKLTSNRCTTCHYFHPNKSQRSNLLLYFQ